LKTKYKENTSELNINELKIIFKKYIDFYSKQKFTKKAIEGEGANKSKQIYEEYEEGKEFLKEPIFNQSYSSYLMKDDERRLEIEKYKKDLVSVLTMINENIPQAITFVEAKPILLSNLKSHSFRVGFINKLLRCQSVASIASIVGHKDILSLSNRW